MAKTKAIRPSIKNLIDFGLEPTFLWTVAAALDGDTITYGAIRDRLQSEIGFSSIGRATRIGRIAGELMNRISAEDTNAPLLNVLVVGQGDGLPGVGAGSFMADYFGVPKLGEKKANERYPNLWLEYSIRGMDEVMQRDTAYWLSIHRKVFGKNLSADAVEAERKARKTGQENDGVQTKNSKYGPGGESKEHEALRKWVTKYPHKVDARFTGALAETEFDLLSGDRVDVMLRNRAQWVAIEVKSRRSNENDYRRGVYQCVKYRAVLEAMDMRELAKSKLGAENDAFGKRKFVEACLVTEDDPGSRIKALLTRHGVRHYELPQKRAK